MLPSKTEDDSKSAEREYALAKAYTEARTPRGRMPGRRRVLTFLGVLVLPMIYAGAMPLISGDLHAGWFLAWVHATSGIAQGLAFLFPGLATGSDRIYGSDPEALGTFLNFASVDLLCVIAIVLIVFVLRPTLSLIPKRGSAQLRYLESTAKGFPIGRTRSSPRVGGVGGGLVFAMFIGLSLAAILYFSYFGPVLGDGQFFVDAHSHCTATAGSGKHSHCIQYVSNDLDQTVWKLGWMSSLASVLLPIIIWMALTNLYYAVWLALGRPTRP